MTNQPTNPLKSPVAIGADHGGADFKTQLTTFLQDRGVAVIDCGTFDGPDVRTDAFDYAVAVSGKIANGEAERGILICRSGIAMGMTANRFPFIRAGLCHVAGAARTAREHNDINVLCLAADLTTIDVAQELVLEFLSTEALGGRYEERRNKLANLDITMFDKE